MLNKHTDYIEILDTTLRDGEQTSGVSFATHEKMSIARFLIEELGVDRVEIASARVSTGELETVRAIAEWATAHGCLDKIEVLGFVDGEQSINWIKSAGCRVMNLLCKSSFRHVSEQLGKTPEQHIADIKNTIEKATSLNMDVNLYLEDWSNGMMHSRDYVFQLIDALRDCDIKRFMLPDTLGILTPGKTSSFAHK